MPARTYEHCDPKSLRNHPLNASVYGTIPDPDFVEKVRRLGITAPIIILPDKTIISGHRRKQAAVIVGLKEVPVFVVRDKTDPDEIEEMLLVENTHREKTEEIVGRELREMVRVQAALAAKRMKAGRPPAKEPTTNLSEVPGAEPQKRKGEAIAIAAEALGKKATTAKKILKVVDAIDEAEAKGDVERAEELRETLNNKSVSAAVEKVKETPAKPADEVLDDLKRAAPEHLADVFEAMQEFKTLNRKLGGLKNDIKALCEVPAGVELKAQWQTFDAAIKSAQSTLKFATPYTECPRCKGKVKDDCELCRGHGFIVRGQDGRLLDADRAWLGLK